LAAFLVAICLFSLFDGLHRFCNCYIAVEAMYRIAPHRCQEKNVVRVKKSSTIFSGMERKRSANRIPVGSNRCFKKIAEVICVRQNRMRDPLLRHIFSTQSHSMRGLRGWFPCSAIAYRGR
jgi:hypothetical protein